MRYKIEKNTVQETLIIPLYARKMCSELYPDLYRDEETRWSLRPACSITFSHFFRFFARVGDGMMKMQIIKVEFGGSL